MQEPSPSMAALQARGDLLAYGTDKALLLFALQLQFNLDNIDSVAAVSLTDHSNDKKCDLVYVDRAAGAVVLAQGYFAADSSKTAAPANKASDLNTAATWLLTGATDGLPDTLRSAALEVRDALKEDQVRDFYIWYCHNLPESENVATELRQAENTVVGLLRSNFPQAGVSSITGVEVGQKRLEELYRRTEAPIIVPDEFVLDVPGGFEVGGDKWSAYCTSISGEWLYEIWDKHKADLMSPNVRGYLGVVRSERNINNGIKSTARQVPDRFWIYNNGLTVLVNEYEVAPGGQEGKLRVAGVGIINGGQTTGSIGTLTSTEAKKLSSMQVMVRFVMCTDTETLAEIVKFNNTQNKVEATDFRSKDAVQEQLRKEFSVIPEADYKGGRRGGVRDAIERSKNLLPDNTVAQALAALHGRPNLAYNETRRIWEDDGVYASLYPRATAKHIVLAFALQRAIEDVKRDLSAIDEAQRTAGQSRTVAYLRRRGSISLLVTAIGASLEAVTGKVIPDPWALAFADNCSPKTAVARWAPVVNVCLPFVNQLVTATDNDLKNTDRVRDAIEKFQSMIESTVESNAKVYDQFAAHLKQPTSSPSAPSTTSNS